jgi:SMODS and SLOG-associating 2TM effector domain 2
MKKKTQDLMPKDFPVGLIWDPGQALVSVEKIYHFVNTQCENSIQWYYDKKKRKKLWGIALRASAIVLVAIAGLIPVLTEMFKYYSFNISPAWATIALAFAALCIALDRFGGCTRGWIRYVQTAQVLIKLKNSFQVEWEKERIQLQASTADKDLMEKAINKCHDFIAEVDNVVSAETDLWAEEFNQVLIELETKMKEKSMKKT